MRREQEETGQEASRCEERVTSHEGEENVARVGEEGKGGVGG